MNRLARCCLALGAALLVLALLPGCRRREQGADKAVTPRFDPAAINGERALADVADFLAQGPRPSGSPAAAKAADYLALRLGALGIEPVIDTFTEKAAGGEITFRNVWGVIPGDADAFIVLAGHYDTKVGIDDAFVGANDSGSSTGLLLELARVMRHSQGDGPEIVFAFFDGEECIERYDTHDGLHGSRHFAKSLIQNSRWQHARAVIVLDMIGDKDLTVTIPRNSTPALVTLAFQAAKAEGTRKYFGLFEGKWGIIDDHVPFLRGGMPAIDLIDMQFGSRPGAHDYWHTTEDTMDKLSAESLQIVGRVVVRMVNALSAPEWSAE